MPTNSKRPRPIRPDFRLSSPLCVMVSALLTGALLCLAWQPAAAQSTHFTTLPQCESVPATRYHVQGFERALGEAAALFNYYLASSNCRDPANYQTCRWIDYWLDEADDHLTQIFQYSATRDAQGECWRCNPEDLLFRASRLGQLGRALEDAGYWLPTGDHEHTHVNISRWMDSVGRACGAMPGPGPTPNQPVWYLDATRINPKNADLQSTRGGGNWETTHSCNLSDTNLGIREETIWSDGSREGYEYQFVFDRPPDQIRPGQSFVVNVRGSGTRWPNNTGWIGQFEMRATGLSVRPTADRVLRITLPDVRGGYEFTVPGSPPDEVVIHAFLWNEAACAVDFVYRKAN